VLGLLLRAFAIRITGRTLRLTERGEPVSPRPREDVDPFGAVAAAIGGMGWDKPISVDEVPRYHGRGRAAAVFASGPLLCILVSQLLFATYVILFTDNPLSVLNVSDVLHGAALPLGQQVLLCLAVGLLAFGLLALIPMPPLDGFGILWSALRQPGAGAQRMRLWLEDKNIGVLILLERADVTVGRRGPVRAVHHAHPSRARILCPAGRDGAAENRLPRCGDLRQAACMTY
jgi:hypothetical protein